MDDQTANIKQSMLLEDDKNFKNFVIQQLQTQGEQINKLAKEMESNTGVTKEIQEIVDLGKGFFKLVSSAGHVLGWLGGISAGAAFIWQFVSTYFKNSGKGP